jgi:hypothetical protein
MNAVAVMIAELTTPMMIASCTGSVRISPRTVTVRCPKKHTPEKTSSDTIQPGCSR